jgi:hypothetical protein
LDHNATKAGWDLYLFGIPLIALLVFGFFKLDQVFTARRGGAGVTRRPPPVVDKTETSMRSDPDGRSWDEESPRKERSVRGSPSKHRTHEDLSTFAPKPRPTRK